MPEALILSLPIVGGFLAATTIYSQRYRVARDSGYRLYFNIVHNAILLTAISLVVVQAVWLTAAFLGATLALEVVTSELKMDIWRNSVDSIQSHKWYIAILAFCFGSMAHFVLNTKEARQKAIERAIVDQDFELMVAKSQSEDKPIMITLDSGKVYVGWAVRGPNPVHQRVWIRILPLASGHRDESQKVQLTVPYARVLTDIFEENEDFVSNIDSGVELEDFEIVISVDNIVSMHLFDISVYNIFDPTGAKLFVSE